MLDDVISERLSIFPGSFPRARAIFKKSESFTGGFSIYIRPPIPIYRIKCNNDFITEKSTKAETGIRKFYKVPGNNSNKEQTGIFQPDASTDFLLSKYRDSHVYTKPRMRKVNKKQLAKAVQLLKRNNEIELQKEIKMSLSKINVHPMASKSKMSGDMKTDVRKKRKIVGNSTTNSKTKIESKNLTQTVSVSKLKESGHFIEGTVRSAHSLRLGPTMSFSNSLLSRLPNEMRSLERSSISNNNEEANETSQRKQGHYTIVTLKNNNDQGNITGEIRSKKMEKINQALKMKVEGNSIDHMFKINKIKSGDLINNFNNDNPHSLRKPNRMEYLKIEEGNTHRVLPTMGNESYKPLTELPNPPNSEHSHTIPIGIISKNHSTKLNQNKEERYLLLPKITPSFESSKSRKKHFPSVSSYPVRQGKSDSTFIHLQQSYHMNT